MTVQELIEYLSKLPKDKIIMILLNNGKCCNLWTFDVSDKVNTINIDPEHILCILDGRSTSTS